MSLDIGRKGWIGLGLQSGFDVPAAIDAYVPFQNNTLQGVVEQLPVNHATGRRDVTLTSVPGKQYSQGNLDIVGDATNAGYLLVATMGSVATTSLGGGVYSHALTENNSNTPQYLTATYDRVKDRQLFGNVAVDELNIEVGLELAMVKAKLKGSFPMTTTSGTNTTASGSVFSFRNGSAAFGASVSEAAGNTNVKPHQFTLNIKNGTDVVHQHGSGFPNKVSHKGFDVNAEGTIYFESTTDRDRYYNQTKQAFVYKLQGVGIGGGYQESLTINLYQVTYNDYDLETGLDNFYASKIKINGEFDTVNAKTLDMTLVNRKSLYI